MGNSVVSEISSEKPIYLVKIYSGGGLIYKKCWDRTYCSGGECEWYNRGNNRYRHQSTADVITLPMSRAKCEDEESKRESHEKNKNGSGFLD